MQDNKSILALDIGLKRIGVARADEVAQIATPLVTIKNDSKVFNKIQQLIEENHATTLVIGIPKNARGEETQQTIYTNEFIGKLKDFVTITMHLQDEALTSLLAKQELQTKSKSYNKDDIDKLAATYILQDYIDQNLRTN